VGRAADPPAAAAAREPVPPVLWPLLFGNFVIGCGVMVVPATLNDISDSLQVGVAAAGQLISAGGLMMSISAPLFAAVVAGWDRRRLLAFSMLWYALLHLACAFAPGMAALLPLRALALLSPAVFTPQAAACVGLLVPAHQRGRAISFIFVGWSVASVLGMPLGAWLGGAFGWRSAFLAVAACAVVSAAWVWRAMPDGVRPPALSRRAWGEVLQSRALMLCLAVTLTYAAGQFVLFSYFAPYFRQTQGLTPTELSLFFMAFGAFGLAGNVWMTRSIDRIGVHRSVLVTVGAMALSMVLWPLGTTVWLSIAVCAPWALGCFSSNSAQQARLVAIAPALAAGSIALNSSAMYAGQALGAAAGGWMVVNQGYGGLHWAALAGLLLSMALSVAATRAATR
jgi:predicted MFS family arabinose efflux permease